MSATDTGAPHDDLGASLTGLDDGADDFLKRFMPDAEEPSETKEKEAPPTEGKEETEAEPEEKAEETDAETPPEKEADEGTEDDKTKRKYAEEEGVYVKVKVGEEEHEVPVKDLKRLYGQEKALTQKSMEVATQRKAADEGLARSTAATSALLERAKAKFAPYQQIDFMLAAKELSAEDYTALRTEAQKAFEDVTFLEKSLDGLMEGIKQKQNTDLVEAAKASLKILSGPVEDGGIEGWGEKKYEDIRAFAVAEGAPPELINKLVDAWAIRLINDAMLYKRGKTKVVTQKINKTPKKVTKTSGSGAISTDSKADAVAKSTKALQRSGSTDAAADAFLARFDAASDD